MATIEEVKDIWRTCDCVCFDVDSTVCVDEGIDQLALFLDKGDAVAELTKEAMQGNMTYEESLGRRLAILEPNRQNLSRFIESHPPQLTPGVKELVTELHHRHIPVYLISGGFTSIINPIADLLSIPRENVIANKLLFFFDGGYGGHDLTQPTGKSGGKPIVIQALKDKYNFKRLVHVGDGATDMEACPPADAFIGFGGNQIREKVKSGSAWFVMDFQEMTQELPST